MLRVLRLCQGCDGVQSLGVTAHKTCENPPKSLDGTSLQDSPMLKGARGSVSAWYYGRENCSTGLDSNPTFYNL